MDKKNEHIDQLTPEIIKAYRSGELTAEQMHQVEVLMLENPLYAEGMEGIESIGLADLSSDLDELTARLDQATDSKVTPFWTSYRRLAAIALLLITSLGLFYLLNDQPPLPTQELSEAKKPATETSKDSNAQDNKIEPPVESKSTPEADIVQETEPEPVKDQIQTTKQVTRDLITENESETLKVFSTETPEEVEIQAAVPRLITLPMKTFDKSLDSMLEVNAPIRAQRSSRQGVLSFSQDGSKMKFDNLALRRSFFPQNNTESSSLLTINGRVTESEDGLPLPQVSVFVKESLQGIGTSLEGLYDLDSIRPGSTIVFRYLGYITQEVKVDTSAVLNIQLVPDATSLGEVVVTGIGLNDEEEEDVSTFAIAKPEGGYPSFNRYLRRNLKYPETAKEQKIRGRVTLEFDVGPTGGLSNFKIIKGLGFGCDEEAIRLVKEGPKWNPRTEGVDKRPVSSTVKIRVRFRP